MKQKYAFRSPPWLRKCVYGMVSAVMMCGLLVVGIGAEDSPPTLTPIPEGTVEAGFVENSNYEKISLTFSGTLKSGSQYAIIMLSGEAGGSYDLLTDEILYIDQKEANDSGSISFELYPMQVKNSVVLLSGDIDGQSKMIPVATTKMSAVEITGTVTSYGDPNAEVTIRLLDSGNVEIAKTTTTTTTYTLNAPAGDYTLEVSKVNHVTREYVVDVTEEGLTQDVKIHLLGDVTGDGRVNSLDYTKVLSQAKKKPVLEGYAFNCGDVSGDRRINSLDYTRILSHAKKNTSLWKEN